MEKWLGHALDYIPQWIEHQMRLSDQPGVALAVSHKGKTVLERAFGKADSAADISLTPRHRFRVASHSKSFTSAGVMRLREQGALTLDDAAGRYVGGLHPAVAKATIGQLLSHSAGIIRDGTDSGQWVDRRPFLDEAELRAALAEPPVIDANTRFKYSNHGFGLLGLVIEAVAGEAYKSWIKRTIVEPAGLAETVPDVPLPRGASMSRGHTGKLPAGRLVIPGDNSTRALAPATGFLSTARDLARFFAALDPAAPGGLLSRASRREMTRRQWRNPNSAIERYYGLGLMCGTTAGWDWFGHAGGFQGFITRTANVPEIGVTLSVLTNAADGPALGLQEGAIHILRQFANHGAPSRRLADWAGRWWSLWGAVDLVPMGERVVVADPAFANPFTDAGEISVSGRDSGVISQAHGYASYGEAARRLRGARGKATALWLGGTRLLPEAKLAAEMARRYAGKPESRKTAGRRRRRS
jgi:CubicO group peptidase (beta-lactamase class C family)